MCADLVLIRPINANEAFGESLGLLDERIAVAPQELLVISVHLDAREVCPVPRRIQEHLPHGSSRQ